METEAILPLPPTQEKVFFAAWFYKEGTKSDPLFFLFVFFFSLIKLEKQRLIYEASYLPAVPAMSLSLPMDVKLQKPPEDKRHLGNASHPVLQLWRVKKRT